MKKEASVGTWRMAEEYLQAASRLSEGLPKIEISMPAYFLFCHAIELALKSFLISQGCTEKGLREIGHDLETAMDEALKHEAFDMHISDRQKAVLRHVNPYYRGKQLEYLAVGVKSFPALVEVEEAANAIVAGVKPRVWSAVRAHVEGCRSQASSG